MADTILERAQAAGCPVSDYEFALTRPLGSYHQKAVDLRDGGPIWMSSLAQGFWMVSNHQLIREMLQTPAVFSSESITPQQPEQGFLFVPGNQDPPEHKAYRGFLNPWFSPKAIRAREPKIRDIARRIVERIAPVGQEDVATGFCLEFATEAFLDLAGLPTEDAEQFMQWVDAFFRGFSQEEAAERGDGTQPLFDASVVGVIGYMRQMLAERRAHPRDPETDMFTALTQYEIDGRPLTEQELDGYTFLLFTGGLDTTRSQLSWLFHRLATNPADRERLVSEPEIIPFAVEESLRYNTIVYAGRKVKQDVTWHGVDLRRGDMMWAILSAGNRDPEIYPNPDDFVLDRDATNIGFGTGIHRCVASHFARIEMRIGIEEFHRLIPEYELQAGAQIKERGVVLALDTVPLRWNT